MIEMTCGAYGAKGRLIRPADGPFSLSANEEKRLVQRGVARYVQEKAAEPVEPDDEEGQDDNSVSPPEEPKKPAKAKKPGNPKEEPPPDLSPEGPVV